MIIPNTATSRVGQRDISLIDIFPMSQASLVILPFEEEYSGGSVFVHFLFSFTFAVAFEAHKQTCLSIFHKSIETFSSGGMR